MEKLFKSLTGTVREYFRKMNMELKNRLIALDKWSIQNYIWYVQRRKESFLYFQSAIFTQTKHIENYKAEIKAKV